MINQETVLAFKRWFTEYVKTFQCGSSKQRRDIDLKVAHTMRVCTEILDIGQSLGLNPGDLCLAEVMALFHDIGRFEQYARYGTYSDLMSEDHARLGVRVLKKEQVLKGLDQTTRELILKAVGYHNGASLPEGETGQCIFFTKLLRDADKLDIWRVVTDYYSKKDRQRDDTIELGLPDTPEISDEVFEDLMEGRIVKMGSLKTLSDFKLLQMAWIYDINFTRTFQLVRERGYQEMIRDSLPETERMLKIFDRVQSYLEEKCKGRDSISMRRGGMNTLLTPSLSEMACSGQKRAQTPQPKQ